VLSVRDDDQMRPFAWQDGRRLWILDGNEDDWVLAELRFEPRACHYVEVRRATYRWFREAAGALLGRTLVGGQPHAEAAANGLSDWAAQVRLSR
jgi:hypothetical protein